MSVNTLDLILQHEDGTLGVADTVHLFAELIRTGQAWSLQGSYGRAAKGFIERGVITPEGAITARASELLAELEG